MDGLFNYNHTNFPFKTMDHYGLLQRTYSLLPHITSIDNESDLINLTLAGSTLMDKYIEELTDEKDFKDLCTFVCLLWNYSQKEARKVRPERVVL